MGKGRVMMAKAHAYTLSSALGFFLLGASCMSQGSPERCDQVGEIWPQEIAPIKDEQARRENAEAIPAAEKTFLAAAQEEEQL
jgi:hypothetical protein